MTRSSNFISVLARVFLGLFILSFIALAVFILAGPFIGNVFTAINESLDPSSTPPPQVSDPDGFGIVEGALLTSVTSLIGFITTTAISWRKEKREAALADVERRKLEIELEKSKLELEKLKGKKPKK